MSWFEKQHESRLCVMESLFEEFQGSIARHMENEEKAFKGFKEDLKEIIVHIDSSQKEALLATATMKSELLHTMEKGYYTQLEVEKQITGMRDSVLKEVEARRAKIFKDVRMGILLVGLTLTGCGWWYVNVAIPTANYRAAAAAGVKQ